MTKSSLVVLLKSIEDLSIYLTFWSKGCTVRDKIDSTFTHYLWDSHSYKFLKESELYSYDCYYGGPLAQPRRLYVQ